MNMVLPTASGRSGDSTSITPTDHCAVCPTRQVCTARDLDGELLDRLAECIDTTRVLQRNDLLYRISDPGDACYVVRSGVFKSVTVTPAGEEYVTRFHYPGELVGLSAQATGKHTDSTVALTASTACRIQTRDFGRLFTIGADNALLRLIAEADDNSRNLEINLRQSRAEARIAGFFILLMRKLTRLGYDPSVLPLPMSRTDLANHLGLTLECLSRVLGKWKRAGVIKLEKSSVEILRQAEIATLAIHLP